MSLLSVNPGSGNPFLSVSIWNDDASDQAWITVRDITPAQLRKCADDLEAELAKKGVAA